MKLAIITVLTSLQTLAINVNSQRTINLNVKNYSVIEVLNIIEQKSDYRFLYENELILYNQKVDVYAKNAPIDYILDQMLRKTIFTYKKINRGLVVIIGDNSFTLPLPIKGKIANEKNEPLVGVSIVEKGTKNGVVSGDDGSYLINVKDENAILEISAVGYISQEVSVKNNYGYIILNSAPVNLNEVVVTALGISQKKKNLTYATQPVSVTNISKARETNIANSLIGKVSGLDIVQASSGLNTAARVVFRGDRSFASSEALVIVDGVPGNLGLISADDIESINTLKGASAAALYGSEAQNGVVIVTTKKGLSGDGKLNVKFSTTSQFEQVVPLRKTQNEYAQGNGGVYSKTAEGAWGPKMIGQIVPHWSLDSADIGRTYALVAHPNNYRDFFSIGNVTTNNISISGGTKSVGAYASITHINGKGVVDVNRLNRTNLNLRLTGTLAAKLSFDAKVGYEKERVENPTGGGEGFLNINRQITRIPSNISLNDVKKYEFYDANLNLRQNYWNPNSNGGENPYWIKNNNKILNNNTFASTLLALTYAITPNLSVMLRNGTNYSHGIGEQKVFFNTYIIAEKGSYSVSQSSSNESTSDFLFQYKNDNLLKNFSANAIFGGMLKNRKGDAVGASASRLVNQNLFTLANAEQQYLGSYEGFWQQQKQSLYGSADLGFKNFLFLTLTGRNDWSSTLPKANWSYFYPSAGLAALISDAVKLPEIISLFKIRASWAQTGNDMGAYQTIQYYGVSTGGKIQKSSTKILESLKPEMTTAREIGFDLNLLDNRINFDFTAYKTNSVNQLLGVLTPPGSGYSQKLINAGNVENNGFEVICRAIPVRTKDFSWNFDVNYSKNKNKVVTLHPKSPEFVLRSDFLIDTRVIEGKPFGELYGVGEVRDENGNVIILENGKPQLTSSRSVYIGNTRPKWLGSLNNRLNYKNISLSVLITARIGAKVASFTDAIMAADGTLMETLVGRSGFIVDGVMADGSKNVKSITAEEYWNHIGGKNTPAGAMFVRDGSNVRLRELVMTYTVPQKLINHSFIKDASVSLTGQNLFFLMNRAKNFDPESLVGTGNGDIGEEAFSVPFARRYGVNLIINF